jgi:hypothetical protein
MYFISDLLEDLTVILIIISWLLELERDRLSVSKRALLTLDLKRFNLKKLNDVEVQEQYRLKSQIGL